MSSTEEPSPSPVESLNTSCENEEIQVTETPEKQRLRCWLNKNLRIEMSDGRILVGAFLCTDRDSNIILSSCAEFLNCTSEEARILGLVMIPGRHIVSIHVDNSYETM